MSPEEIDALMKQVSTGAIAPKTAIALMGVNGHGREESACRVFYAIGGSDAVRLDSEGRPYYEGSGKLVANVEQMIAENLGLNASHP